MKWGKVEKSVDFTNEIRPREGTVLDSISASSHVDFQPMGMADLRKGLNVSW